MFVNAASLKQRACWGEIFIISANKEMFQGSLGTYVCSKVNFGPCDLMLKTLWIGLLLSTG